MTNKNNDFEKFVVKPKDIKVLERQSFKQKTPHLFDSKGNIESEWIYGNSNIFVTRFFDSGKVESKEVFDLSLIHI